VRYPDQETFDQKYTAGKCTGLSCSHNKRDYSYKAIPSWMLHVSPTYEEYAAQTKAKYPDSLPADGNRYIDFANGNGEYAKIEYPNLFRIKLVGAGEISYS